MTTSKGVRPAAMASLVSLILLGCSAAPGPDKPQLSGGTATPSGPTPEFTGLYAAQFAHAYGRSKDDLTGRILAKGTSTDDAKFSSCTRNPLAGVKNDVVAK